MGSIFEEFKDAYDVSQAAQKNLDKKRNRMLSAIIDDVAITIGAEKTEDGLKVKDKETQKAGFLCWGISTANSTIPGILFCHEKKNGEISSRVAEEYKALIRDDAPVFLRVCTYNWIPAEEIVKYLTETYEKR